MHARAMKTMTTTAAAAATTLRATQSPAAVAAPSPLAPPPRSAKAPPFRAGARLSRAKTTKNNSDLRSLVAAAADADAPSPSSSEAPPPLSSPASPSPSRGGPPPPRPGALPFDTPLAIALAGAAFEAYNSPAGFEMADPSGRDFAAFVDADGTMTRYFDPQVLAAATCGGAVASLRVSRAEGLPASDAWGTSDPYFVAELRGRAAAHRSAVVPRTCNPTFDDDFELFVGRGRLNEKGKEEEEDPLDAILKISLFDSDALTADDALGSAEISLRELEKQGAAGEVELALVAAGGETRSAGSVFLSGGVRTLSETELAARASGSIAPDGTDEVARMSRAWRSLARAAAGGGGGGEGKEGEDASSIFEPAAFIENPATDTQLWVGIDGPTRRLMIAFRGTETTKILDVLTDLNATKAPLDARAAPGEPGALALPPYARVSPRSAARGGPPLAPMDRDALWCHQGFLAAYRSVRCSVLRVVGECLASAGQGADASDSSSTPWTILLTGHSLGGALATLCAYELAHLELADAGEAGVERLVVYNFGSPRVGSGAFASHFDASLPDAWRVVNAADLVPRVPRLMGYAHVGHAVPLRSDGTFDDEAIAENYAAGLYGDGDYVPVSPSAISPSSSSPAKHSFASPAAASSEEIEPVFDEEGANVITAATALAQAAASALFGGVTRKRSAEEAGAAAAGGGSEGGGSEGGGGEGGGEGGGYLTEKQAAADAVSKLLSSEMRTMGDFLSGDAVVHHTEAVYLEVLRKAVGAAGELARELAEEARGENAEGEVEAAAKKAAEAAQELIKEAQR